MYIMCYDTYASDKKLINQIQHNTNNHTLKYCDQNGVKCFIFDIVCYIWSCHTKVRLAAIHIQMSVNESIKAWVFLVTRLPWTFPARAAAPRAAGHGTTASSAPMTTTTSVSIRWGRKRIVKPWSKSWSQQAPKSNKSRIKRKKKDLDLGLTPKSHGPPTPPHGRLHITTWPPAHTHP